MTCVVGLVEGDTVYIGADSLGSDLSSSHCVVRSDEKVFVSGDLLMGFCGSFRAGQLIRYAFEAPDTGAKRTPMGYMVVDFIDALRESLAEHGARKKADDEEESFNGQLLVGYEGVLYSIEEDFDVGTHSDGHYAIGAGAQFAFGSLHATKGLIKDPRKRIEMALHAAAAYSSAVREPFTILAMTAGQPNEDDR